MRISRAALTVVVLGLVAAGCGEEDPPSTASGPTSDTSTAASTAASPSAASPSPTEEPPPLTGTDVHWGYSGEVGPTHWGELSADYETCAAGVEQSPVDLHAGDAGTGEDLELDYGDIDEHLVDNGHAIQLVNDEIEEPDDDELDDHLVVDGVDYELQQFHFHAPSEHTVDGAASPVEFHFVHGDADGDLAVLGVLVREVAADNPAWAPFVEAASTPDEQDVPGHLDIGALLPQGAGALEHWQYDGSLTTPPCSEGVRWMVLDHPIELSADQITALESAYVDNNRPVQPLGDREVDLLAD